jgi:hypothetical protein
MVMESSSSSFAAAYFATVVSDAAASTAVAAISAAPSAIAATVAASTLHLSPPSPPARRHPTTTTTICSTAAAHASAATPVIIMQRSPRVPTAYVVGPGGFVAFRLFNNKCLNANELTTKPPSSHCTMYSERSAGLFCVRSIHPAPRASTVVRPWGLSCVLIRREEVTADSGGALFFFAEKSKEKRVFADGRKCGSGTVNRYSMSLRWPGREVSMWQRYPCSQHMAGKSRTTPLGRFERHAFFIRLTQRSQTVKCNG